MKIMTLWITGRTLLRTTVDTKEIRKYLKDNETEEVISTPN